MDIFIQKNLLKNLSAPCPSENSFTFSPARTYIRLYSKKCIYAFTVIKIWVVWEPDASSKSLPMGDFISFPDLLGRAARSQGFSIVPARGRNTGGKSPSRNHLPKPMNNL